MRFLRALLCAAILLCLLPLRAQAVAAREAEEILYEGACTVVGNWAVAADTAVSADPSAWRPGSSLCAVYTASEDAPSQLCLVLTGKRRISVFPTCTMLEDGVRYAYFGYNNLLSACGGSFDGIDGLCLQTCQPGDTVNTTFLRLFMVETMPALPDADALRGEQVLFSGLASASSSGTTLGFFYTAHAGGKWDACEMPVGSSLCVEYSGSEVGIYLAFSSASGDTPWVAIYPDMTVATEDGSYLSCFSYENFTHAYGTSLSRLDQIQCYSLKSGQTVLHRITLRAGDGEVPPRTDGQWLRPDSGIAFVGDSIVQNPLVDTQHLGAVDWNGILGRTDCANYGIGGQTTRELLRRISHVAQREYDTVVFLCGINDIGRNISNAEIVGNYRKMIAALRESNPQVRIVLISVLPTTPAYYTDAQDRIAGLNTVLEVMAQQTDVLFVDAYSAFVGQDGYCKEGLTFDGLHPNMQGYAVLAQLLTPVLDAPQTEAPPATEPPATEPSAPTTTAPAQTVSPLLYAGVLVPILCCAAPVLRRRLRKAGK